MGISSHVNREIQLNPQNLNLFTTRLNCVVSRDIDRRFLSSWKIEQWKLNSNWMLSRGWTVTKEILIVIVNNGECKIDDRPRVPTGSRGRSVRHGNLFSASPARESFAKMKNIGEGQRELVLLINRYGETLSGLFTTGDFREQKKALQITKLKRDVLNSASQFEARY